MIWYDMICLIVITTLFIWFLLWLWLCFVFCFLESPTMDARQTVCCSCSLWRLVSEVGLDNCTSRALYNPRVHSSTSYGPSSTRYLSYADAPKCRRWPSGKHKCNRPGILIYDLALYYEMELRLKSNMMFHHRPAEIQKGPRRNASNEKCNPPLRQTNPWRVRLSN